MSYPLNRNEHYWRDRMEEMRLLAASMHSPEEKHVILEMALTYMKLAERARERCT